ncbi:hypothetical protein L7F22_053443 [Adiantum nelumboides]|nr:hypothetical protein [Adiantum nelumboides]
MPIIICNKAKGVDHADEIPISMTQESGSSQGTTSIIEPFNITTLDLVPSSMVPTSDTPSVATNEPLSDCFGSLVDSHILAGWIDSHILPYSHLLPCIPLCRLLANPAICTQDDCVAELTTLIAERGYQPTMAQFIVTECFPGQSPMQFDRRGVRGRELHMSASFDDQILQISELKHMEEKMFVVWDGNHRLHAWREWTYHERFDEFSTPRVECILVTLNPTKMAEFLLILSMINNHESFQVAAIASGSSIATIVEEFDRMYQEKIQNLPGRDTREYMDPKEDYEASYAMALKAIESVFVRKGLEIAVIANLDNGFDFFRLCISFLSWGERGCKMTTFRVSEIARAHITSQEKCRLLDLLTSGDAALKEAGIPSNEKPFSQWLRMHVYWWQLERGLQDICRLLESLLYTGQRDPNARLGGVRLMWADLPTHCKVDAGEFLLDDGALVVACRVKHLFKVISEACEFQFHHIRTLFLRMPSHTYVMDCNFTDSVATLIVAMFVRDLDGPLPVPFYDRRAGDIAANIDGYEVDSDMLREPLQESSWTLDTSGAAF